MYAAPRLFCQLLLYLLLALPTALLAQQTTLTGTVVDAGSGQPIPFATVELPTRQVGVQATETGTFTLALPANLSATDSLRVASLGFMTRMMALPGGGAAPVRLTLRALPVPLAEVVVRASTKPLVQLGPGEDAGRFGFSGGNIRGVGSTGWQVARQFMGGPAGYLKAVRFYVKSSANCGKRTVQAPFRVRLYAADGPGGAPGTDLLTTSLLTAAGKKGWHEVDVAKYSLRAPAAGFFVAMEWLYTDDAFGCDWTYTDPNSKQKKTTYHYGQTLGGYFEDVSVMTWYLAAGFPWQRFQIRSNLEGHSKVGPSRNAAIQAIIQPD